ncbi:hypothetical protein BACDOR_03656 [Phocaeicola dorei DSM 17855]|uniref:Uncharacterized protein n=1 Tax=Phocaeicola dorei DSM 17855 TaxID=483217 RepID=B6W202_9BACT|nr:hypothetical protein BACDOR_03656 [Phocaeicola dorei DSM 17855]
MFLGYVVFLIVYFFILFIMLVGILIPVYSISCISPVDVLWDEYD